MANSYLTHTTSTPTNDKIMTFSFWIKKGKEQEPIMSRHIDGSNRFQFYNLDGSVGLQLYQQVSGSVEMNLSHDRQFRDFNAWYHTVIAIDTTQVTASDRVKIYINGELLSGYSTATYPDQNADILFNGSSVVQEIGRTNASDYYNGYMSHFAFVDGTALTPTSFGETDSTSGIWKFKAPSVVSWGNNGFHLKFENSGNLGLDSANSNNFTVTGDLKQALDTPSNVYATMNSLNPNPNIAYLEGNNTVFADSGGDLRTAVSTLGATSGKYYAEVKIISIQDAQQVGLVAADSFAKLGASYGNAIYQFENSLTYMSAGKIKNYNNNTVATGLATFTTNDILGIAADLDNSKIYFHKNGTYINSGVPTSGSTGTGAYSLTANTTYLFANAGNYNNGKVSWNFGNGFFGTTAITSAGSNGNGSLFEYDVPSGYYALNTKNLNTYG